MQHVLEMPTEELLAMGERGRTLVKQKFTASRVAEQMKHLYKWLSGNHADKPDFIYL